VGNVSIPAIALCCTAVWAASQQKETATGILLGVATCLKPQLGLWFLLYCLLRKRWRVGLVVVTLGALVLTIGVLRLEMSGVLWWQDYLSNARGFAMDNKTVDFTDADPIRFTLINLQVLFHSLLRSTAAAGPARCSRVQLFSGAGFGSDQRGIRESRSCCSSAAWWY
jgi:Glycosyltransferase family 87